MVKHRTHGSMWFISLSHLIKRDVNLMVFTSSLQLCCTHSLGQCPLKDHPHCDIMFQTQTAVTTTCLPRQQASDPESDRTTETLTSRLSVLCVQPVSCLSLLLSTHQPGAWPDSLGTDVNKLCLRQPQTQNVCDPNYQSHMSLLVFHPSCFLQQMTDDSSIYCGKKLNMIFC